jgi:foldase protein PrsA
MVPIGCGGNLPKGAVAQVGQTLITQEQFDSLKTMYEEADRAPDKDSQEADYTRFEQSLAEYLVTLEVLKQEAASFEVEVGEQDVQAEIAKIKDMFDGDEERFNAALKKQNLTLEQLTRSLSDNLLLDRMKAAVTSDLTVTDEEAKAYYQEHRSDFVQQEERKTSHILISPFPSADDSSSASQADWDAAQAEAEKVRGEIQNGADFANVAKKYSDDATTKESGGALGLITKGQMVPAFEEAVFSLKKGELSEPVKTQYGYHLILVKDIVPEEQLSYDEASQSIKSTLLTNKQDEAWKTWLAGKEKALGVEYRSGLKPPAATTGSTVESDTSTSEDSTTTSTEADTTSTTEEQ